MPRRITGPRDMIKRPIRETGRIVSGQAEMRTNEQTRTAEKSNLSY